MKKVLLLALSLLMVTPAIHAIDKEEVKTVLVKDESTGDYVYEEVVPVENISRDELYKKLKSWILTHLETVDNNIKFDDEHFSLINGSSVLLQSFGGHFSDAMMAFKISIAVKDGRYKFSFTDVNVYLKLGDGFPVQAIPYSKIKTDDRKGWRKVNENLSDQVNSILSELGEKLKKDSQTSTPAKDNW